MVVRHDHTLSTSFTIIQSQQVVTIVYPNNISPWIKSLQQYTPRVPVVMESCAAHHIIASIRGRKSVPLSLRRRWSLNRYFVRSETPFGGYQIVTAMWSSSCCSD